MQEDFEVREKLQSLENQGEPVNLGGFDQYRTAHVPVRSTETTARLPEMAIVDGSAETEAVSPRKSAALEVGRAGELSQEKPAPGEEKLAWRGKQLALRTENGVGVYFQDDRGQQWASQDGNTWIRKGSHERDIWHGRIRTENGNIVQEGVSYGVTTVYGRDGSLSKSFQTADDRVVSLTQHADGRRQLKNGEQIWESRDGNRWNNGESTWQGKVSIDRYGRLHEQERGRQWEQSEESARTQEITSRTKELVEKYNVKIGFPGEQVRYDESGMKVELRMPTKAELEVLEESLQKYTHVADHSKGKPDFGGLKIGFVSAGGNGVNDGLWGWYNSPDTTKGTGAELFFSPRNARTMRGWESLEGTALHELAHHLQYKRWEKDKAGTDVPPAAVLQFFGFEGENPYRLRDQKGKLWEFKETSKDSRNRKLDEGWYPVVDDKVVHRQGMARDNEQMRNALPEERRPSTTYFDYPAEAHAEAQAMLIHNREMLFRQNSRLYQVTKEWDQKHIDRAYGMQTDELVGPSSRMIRGVDGRIVPNTSEQRERIEQEERHWQRTPISEDLKARMKSHQDHHCRCGGHHSGKSHKAEVESAPRLNNLQSYDSLALFS